MTRYLSRHAYPNSDKSCYTVIFSAEVPVELCQIQKSVCFRRTVSSFCQVSDKVKVVNWGRKKSEMIIFWYTWYIYIRPTNPIPVILVCQAISIEFIDLISTVRCSYNRYIQRSNPILPHIALSVQYHSMVIWNILKCDLKHSSIVREL